MTWTTLRAATAGALTLALLACGGDDGPAGVPSATPASVRIEPTAATVAVGATRALAATVRDAAGATLAGRAVTWQSSAAAIAQVDANGVVTGVAPGSATISATHAGLRDEARVTVETPAPAAVASVTLTPATAALRVGDTVTLAAVPRDAQGAALAGRTVRFASSAPAVATVDSATGLVRAVAAGSATVTATSEGRSATAGITVQPPAVPVAAVLVSPTLDTLEATQRMRLSATLHDAAGNALAGRTVRWASSDRAVATIDSVTGDLLAVDRGTVTITATSEGITATATRVIVVRYRSIVTGTMHACDIASGGIAWCWGLAGSEGRLGDGRTGATEHSAAPVRVSSAIVFVQLAAFGRHTCGITHDGRAYCWGYNGWGQLGAGAGANPLTTPTPVAGGLTFRSIAVGTDHSCGVATDGRAHCWGHNDVGQLGTGTTVSRDVPQPVAGEHRFASLALGTYTTCGITDANVARCWGSGTHGLLGAPSAGAQATTPHPVDGATPWRDVSVGNVHACGLDVQGAAWCWGANGGRLGDGGGTDAATPRAVVGGVAFRTISAGFAHTCGVAADAAVWCWGINGYGELGVPGGPRDRPTRVAGIAAAEVSAAGVGTGSGGHTCAISADRLTTWCWGLNDVGQLGTGSTTPSSTQNPTPSPVQGQRPRPAAR